jgi:hypothetical protein
LLKVYFSTRWRPASEPIDKPLAVFYLLFVDSCEPDTSGDDYGFKMKEEFVTRVK